MRALPLFCMLAACSSSPSKMSSPDLAGSSTPGDDLAQLADASRPFGDDGPPVDLAMLYAVGGTVSGLASGATLVLADNGGDFLTVSEDGAFVFATALGDAVAYSVTVATQPAAQTCTVNAGSGIIAAAAVSSVVVTCVDSYSVGGTVSGLDTGKSITLQNNGGDTLVLSANGPFTMPTRLVANASYAVTISTAPTGEVCTVGASSGTIGTSSVGDIAVTCGHTVSVVVTGLNGSGLVIQNNGTGDISISQNMEYTFAATLADNAGYSITVLNQPSAPEQICTVADATGMIASGPVAVVVTCLNVVVPGYPTNGANWLQYVHSDGSPCVATTDGPGYGACIHGGESRVFPVSGRASCAGLTAQDSRSAFAWTCQVVNGTAQMVTSALADTQRLATLIDSTGLTWQPMSLTVKSGGTSIMNSAVTTWWTNPIADLPNYNSPSDTTVTLNATGTIYLVRTATSRNLVLGDQVALVVEASLSPDGTRAAANFIAATADYLWIEGIINRSGINWTNNNRFSVFLGITCDSGIFFGGSKNRYGHIHTIGATSFPGGSTVQHINASSSSSNGVTILGGGSQVSDVTVSNGNDYGLLIGSSNNTITDVQITGNQGGLYVTGNQNTISNLQDLEGNSAGSNDGVYLAGSHNALLGAVISRPKQIGLRIDGSQNRATDVIIGEVVNQGVYVQTGAVENSVVGLTVDQADTSNAVPAVELRGDNSRILRATVAASGGGNPTFWLVSNSNLLAAITAPNNAPSPTFSVQGNNNTILSAAAIDTNVAFQLSGAGEQVADVLGYGRYFFSQQGGSTAFSGLIKIGTGAACDLSSGSANLDGTCAQTGGSMTLRTGVTVGGTFVGRVLADDVANPNDNSGVAAFGSITNWTSFDNAFRGWGPVGPDGGPFPDGGVGYFGSCTANNCRIWDWSAKIGDTGDGGEPVVLAVLGTPAAEVTQTWAAANSPSCTALNVAAPNWNGSSCTSKLLAHAVEIMNDGIGNENGLCETGETCLFAPNIGSYQGHGALVAGPSIGTIGSTSGVTLQQYAVNGY